MAKLTRVKPVAGWAAAPMTLHTAARAERPGPCAVDPVVAKVRAWIVEHEARDAMMMEWQDLESALCSRIRPTGMSLAQGMRSGLPEARTMRAIDRRIKASGKRLDREAGGIVLMRAVSLEGALAKIQMGVKLQGPYDWEEHAYALVLGGIEQLREIV